MCYVKIMTEKYIWCKFNEGCFSVIGNVLLPHPRPPARVIGMGKDREGEIGTRGE